MNKHEEKYCPRCNEPFFCKTGDIVNCQCQCVPLSEETIQFLSKTYFDCLCKNCLSELNQKVKISKSYRFPTQKEMFVEGLHYYREDGKWVFTELYHILRGNCCGSGCRHCVFGFSSMDGNKDKRLL